MAAKDKARSLPCPLPSCLTAAPSRTAARRCTRRASAAVRRSRRC
jgi:hypothetical protein